MPFAWKPGFSVTSARSTTTLGEAGMVVRHVPFGSGRDVVGALRFASLGRSFARVPTSFTSTSGAIAHLDRAAPLARKARRPPSCNGEDGRPLDLRTFGRSADVVVATSRAVADKARVIAVVVHPGVELPLVPAGSGSGRVVGTAGRLEPVKRVDLLLGRRCQAAPHISGPEGADCRRRRVASRAGTAGESPVARRRRRVRGLAERHRESSPRAQRVLYSVGARGVRPRRTRVDGSGLPVVATRVGGLAELIDDGRSGFLVPAGDVDALADRITRLLADPGLRARMGAAARRAVEERFTADRMVRRIDAVYRNLLE